MMAELKAAMDALHVRWSASELSDAEYTRQDLELKQKWQLCRLKQHHAALTTLLQQVQVSAMLEPLQEIQDGINQVRSQLTLILKLQKSSSSSPPPPPPAEEKKMVVYHDFNEAEEKKKEQAQLEKRIPKSPPKSEEPDVTTLISQLSPAVRQVVWGKPQWWHQDVWTIIYDSQGSQSHWLREIESKHQPFVKTHGAYKVLKAFRSVQALDNNRDCAVYRCAFGAPLVLAMLLSWRLLCHAPAVRSTTAFQSLYDRSLHPPEEAPYRRALLVAALAILTIQQSHKGAVIDILFAADADQERRLVAKWMQPFFDAFDISAKPTSPDLLIWPQVRYRIQGDKQKIVGSLILTLAPPPTFAVTWSPVT